MLHHLAGAAAPMLKRAVESGESTNLPWWTFLILLADLILLLPVILLVSYTFKAVFPVLTIIEDQNPPPAYQPVPLHDDDAAAAAQDDGEPDSSINKNVNDPTIGDRPVTSSLRATWALLKSQGGYRALFRGFWALVACGLAQGLVFLIVSAALPGLLAPLATVISALVVVQLSTAWVHVVSTPQTARPYWRRLPPFGKTFRAVAPAAVLYAAAEQLANLLPFLVAWLAGVRLPDPTKAISGDYDKHYAGHEKTWLAVPIAFSVVLPYFLFVVPAFAVLVRVQASLLPPEENTIVPFDRSFGGRVEPAVVDGKGYATIKEAWATFGRESWKRIYWVLFKLFLVDLALMALIFAVVIPEFLVVGMILSRGKAGEQT